MKNTTLKRSKLGFTLAELLLVIAILVILVGVGVTGFVALRQNIVIAKYDDLAREIYVAAQNQLTRLEANGMDQASVDALNGGEGLTARPSDYTKEDWEDVKAVYRYADKSNNAMTVLLPLGTMADDVRTNGFYVIEYNMKTRTVYGVFYSEKNFKYEDVCQVANFRFSRDARKGPMVGYYGGSSVERDSLLRCETPKLEIINNNELRLNILGVPADVEKVTIQISDGTETMTVPINYIEYTNGTENPTVLLDGMNAGEHFRERFADLKPGKDLTITVVYEKTGAIASSASIKANSLFATRDGEIVTLEWARHLQNLEGTVSGLNDPEIKTARQTEHIQWEDDFDPFVSINNENLIRFEGNRMEIRDLRGSNGLFEKTKEGTNLSGIRLVNPVIASEGTEPVGALVGTAASDTKIHMCGVYSNKLTDDKTVDYSAYKDCYVDGKNAVTGGLVGKATDTTVTDSFAALPSIQGQSGAALIGEASGCTIENSYANCDDLPSGFHYFISGNNNTIEHCYAVGNVADTRVSAFAADADKVTNSYYAVSHRKFGATDITDLGATEFRYIVDGSDWTTINQEQMKNATADGGWAHGQWDNMIAPLSHPYREYLDGRAFPYPAIGELDHYGSWPDGDGTVSLTIDMSLLNDEEDAYAFFAGQVVVTDQKGNELFDSKKHIKLDGTFDGENTVQVPIGNKVTVEITKAEGYKYLYTINDGTRYFDKSLEYTISKDTKIDVIFQQEAYMLNGLCAVNEQGHDIRDYGVGYDIDLISPLKTINITTASRSEKVETGSKVTVRPKVPAAYSGSVVWYTPKGINTVESRTYLTQEADGSYIFIMPAKDTDIHVMYTSKEAFFEIEYYLMDTDGKYPTIPTQTADYKCGLGTQMNQSMINALAESSGLPLMIDDERVRYLEEAIVTSHQNAYQDVVFHSTVDKDGKVTVKVGPHLTTDGKTSETQPYHVKIYIARKEYNVTLTAEEHVTGVRFGETGAFRSTVTQTFRYGATVTAQAEVAQGYQFTYWDPKDSRFMMSAEEKYTFEVPQFDLNLRANAALDQQLVTIHLLENDESWLYSDESRKADPITLILVNSKDPSKEYPMQVLTEDSISYAMQVVVPVIPDYGVGYYVRVDYKSGRTSWIYTSGIEDGTDDDNERMLLYVRDRAVERTARFYTVTYYPNKAHYSGSAPKAGSYPEYYHLTVEGNSGLLRNLTDKDTIFQGWKDYYVGETGSDVIYTGKEILMVTRRTDMFAQWTDSLTVIYHDDYADGGTLPVDRNGYQPRAEITIQWGSLTRRGYKFIGWSMTQDDTTPDFTADGEKYQLTSTSLNLYPVWEREEYTVQFYDVNGNPLTGDHYVFKNKHYGDLITTPRKGNDNDIIGWSTTKGGEVVYQPGESFQVTGNTHLYACISDDTVTVTYMDNTGTYTYETAYFGRGIPGYLNCVPASGMVTAWSTQPEGKGELYFCQEDGRSERAIAFTENDTRLYAVTGKVYNYNKQLWFDTLYAAVRDRRTVDGDTLIVYRDTTEQYNIWLNKSLYIIASGNRTVKWKDGATVDGGDYHRLNDVTKETDEFVGCMNVSNGNAAVTVHFGKSDIPTLSTVGSTLTFDANHQSRVIALANKATFHMYDGITLTNGKRERTDNEDQNSNTAQTNPMVRSFYGGGVYAGLESVFYMHGGTISYCTAYKGGGVYLFANKKKPSTPGSRMFMGDMVTPTVYSSTAIYYTKGPDGFYINAPEKVTAENYKKYYVTTGNPEICYNTATREFENEWANDDGGGGLLMLDLQDGDLVLYRGRIYNNTAYANGGGIISDGGSKTTDEGAGDDAKLRIYEVDISHNTAHGYGGGIFQWQGMVYIYNSTLRQNYAKKSGGGIYLHHYGNEKSTVEFHYGDIADNKADENGGGVYVENHQEMTIVEGNLARNTAGWNGGGVYVFGVGADPGTLLLNGGTLSDNTAKQNGGGIYSVGAINMSGGTLSGNNAENNGGGIYFTGNMTMSGGTIRDNNGRYLGGGIMVGGDLYLSGGSLYGNTDTDYQSGRADEDDVNPAPNDIYLIGNHKIIIPDGGIALSGEKRVAVDCERDNSLRFNGNYLPYQFATYAVPGNFEPEDALYFTYYGSRSTDYWIVNQGKSNLEVKTHENLSGNRAVGLYFAEKTSTDESSFVTFDLNYPECPPAQKVEKNVGDVLNLKEEVKNADREGYYLVGWARTPDAVEEDYILFYDVVADVWKTDYKPGEGWTKTLLGPEYTVQNLYNQTLYAMWRPCVVVYDIGEAEDYGVVIQSTSVGPRVTILNPHPMQYTVDDKTSYFMYWEDASDESEHYMPMQQLELNKNLRLKAKWGERDADSVIITFYFNDGTSDQTGELRREVTVKKGVQYDIDVEVHQANKILVGWNTSKDGKGTQYEPNGSIGSPEKDMNLYAIWADAVTLTYNLNGGEGNGTVISLEKGKSVTITNEEPKRSGYKFMGWAEKPDAAEAEYGAGKIETVGPLNENRTLYAVWKKILTVTYDLNGGAGDGFNSSTVLEGESYTISSSTPTREGCGFLGWDDGVGTRYASSATIQNMTSDITLKAAWECNVTFDLNYTGKPENRNETWEIGKAYRPDQPTRDGYVFRGWAESDTATVAAYAPDSEITIDGPLTLYAVWQSLTP